MHASQQYQKHASNPFISPNSASQHAGSSRQKAALDMSGERISGSMQSSSGSHQGSGPTADAAWSNAHDDVELEKSNILMLGPTGQTATVW